MFTIFISHTHKEGELSNLLGNAIVKEFPKAVEVFNSSNDDSIGVGMDFVNKINKALLKCQYAIFIISPYSVGARWINLEFGAIYLRNLLEPELEIPSVPFCHSGLLTKDLPHPLDIRIDAIAHSEQDLKRLFTDIGRRIDWPRPISSKKRLAEKIAQFENRYQLENKQKDCVKEIHHVNLAVSNLKDSVDFYCDKLELRLIKRPKFRFGGAWFCLPNGQHLHLVEQTGLKRQPDKLPVRGELKTPPDAHFALQIADDKWDDYEARVRDAVGSKNCVDQPFGNIPMRQVYVLDPDNYLIEITKIQDSDKKPGYIEKEEWEHYAYWWRDNND